jgi:hypothetical protein
LDSPDLDPVKFESAEDDDILPLSADDSKVEDELSIIPAAIPEDFVVEEENTEVFGEEESPEEEEIEEIAEEIPEEIIEELPGEIPEETIEEFSSVSDDSAAAISKAVIPEAPSSTEEISEIPASLKTELRTVLSYMDQLLEALPDDKIEEFAKSEYYDTYKKLFKELGLA